MSSPPRTNDHLTLTPQPPPSDSDVLTFDFPAFAVGVAEYPEGPTGCTVFHFPEWASVAVDVRGGSPGFVGDYGIVDAICLAGGSAYGLEATAGVAAELLAMRGYRTDWNTVALVSGGIIYDFGTRRDNAVYPDKALGRAALRWAAPGRFPLGPRGAGCSARVGAGFDYRSGEPGGQGGAFRQAGETKIAVFTVVNAVGAITDRAGRVVRGLRNATDGHFTLAADLDRRLAGGLPTAPTPGNTTLTVIITNQKLDAHVLRQVGRQVHASMARAIQPFHTLNDGDVLWAVTTNEVDGDALSPLALGVLASELLWDAVLACYEGSDLGQ